MSIWLTHEYDGICKLVIPCNQSKLKYPTPPSVLYKVDVKITQFLKNILTK